MVLDSSYIYIYITTTSSWCLSWTLKHEDTVLNWTCLGRLSWSTALLFYIFIHNCKKQWYTRLNHTQEPLLHSIDDADAPISNCFRRLVQALWKSFWFYDFIGMNIYGDFMVFYVLLGVWQMSPVGLLWKLFKDSSKRSNICHYVPKKKQATTKQKKQQCSVQKFQ